MKIKYGLGDQIYPNTPFHPFGDVVIMTRHYNNGMWVRHYSAGEGVFTYTQFFTNKYIFTKSFPLVYSVHHFYDSIFFHM